jgi:hypothetical protein
MLNERLRLSKAYPDCSGKQVLKVAASVSEPYRVP